VKKSFSVEESNILKKVKIPKSYVSRLWLMVVAKYFSKWRNVFAIKKK